MFKILFLYWHMKINLSETLQASPLFSCANLYTIYLVASWSLHLRPAPYSQRPHQRMAGGFPTVEKFTTKPHRLLHLWTFHKLENRWQNTRNASLSQAGCIWRKSGLPHCRLEIEGATPHQWRGNFATESEIKKYYTPTSHEPQQKREISTRNKSERYRAKCRASRD